MKALVYILVSFILATPMWAQKPSIMVIPADIYMSQNGYGSQIEGVGEKIFQADYNKLFLNDRNARTVIQAIDRAFLDMGYPTKNLEMELKNISQRNADMILSERQSQISARDVLLTGAKSDIVIDVDFNVEYQMGSPIILFTLTAYDSYTSKAVASSPNMQTAPGGSTPLQTLVQEAVIKNMPTFEQYLVDHFEDIVANGRTAIVEFTLGENSSIDMEEYIDIDGDDEELSFILRDLVRNSTVNKAPRVKTSTRTLLQFEDVKVPLYDIDGQQQDVASWANANIVRKLRNDYRLDVRREEIGLGAMRLIIMGKR